MASTHMFSTSAAAARLLKPTVYLLLPQNALIFPRRLFNAPRSLSIHFSQSSSASIVDEKVAKSETKLEIVNTRLDGKKVAETIRGEIAEEVSRMKDAIGIVPGLAVILVGDREESATYVSKKKEACEIAGITSFEVHLPEDATEQQVLDAVEGFNKDPDVHGILVQLPQPKVGGPFLN